MVFTLNTEACKALEGLNEAGPCTSTFASMYEILISSMVRYTGVAQQRCSCSHAILAPSTMEYSRCTLTRNADFCTPQAVFLGIMAAVSTNGGISCGRIALTWAGGIALLYAACGKSISRLAKAYPSLSAVAS